MLSYFIVKASGNVGVQIHKIDPINYGEKVWVINPEDVVNIGLLFSTGQFSAQRTLAVVGSSVGKPQYYKATVGAALKPYLDASLVSEKEEVRIINGDVLVAQLLRKKVMLVFITM